MSESKKGKRPPIVRSALHDMEKMLVLLQDFTFKPKKGRPKDLRRVEHLVAQLIARVDEW